MPRRLGVSSHAAAAKLGVPKQPIIREDRPSWVCVMKNPKRPPCRTEDGKLDRRFEYLTDPRGERVPAREFFRRKWWPTDFDEPAEFEVCKPADINNDVVCLWPAALAVRIATTRQLPSRACTRFSLMKRTSRRSHEPVSTGVSQHRGWSVLARNPFQ